MIQGSSSPTIVSGDQSYTGPSVTIATSSSSSKHHHRSPRSMHKGAAAVAQLQFSVLQEFFKSCEVGDVCAEEEVVVDDRSHFHCLLCQAVIRSASKLQDHCVRHANSKHLPQEHEMCVKYFTRYTPTCSQNCQLSQSATRHRHCKLCGGAHTDPESQSLGYHIERWHTRHYTEVKEIVDLARKLKTYLQPGDNHHHIHESEHTTDSIGAGGDASESQAVYNEGEVHPGSWETSTTQMTDGTLATVHQWTGTVPPVYPPSCTVQSMEQAGAQQGTNQSYILQEHQMEQQHPTNSQFVIQEAAAQSGVDGGSYTLHVDTSSLNPSQEAASIILQMMDRVQMPATDNPAQGQAQQQGQASQEVTVGGTPVDSSERTLSPSNRKRSSRVSSLCEEISGSSTRKQTKTNPMNKIQIELPSAESTSAESLPLVFRSKPLPGTIIDPSVKLANPKVCQQCLVCGSSSYLRSIRVHSEGSKRTVNKAQTARLMSYYRLAVDPTLPGKLICRTDFDEWLKFDKNLQTLMQGGAAAAADENAVNSINSSNTPGAKVTPAKRPGRKPLGADRKAAKTMTTASSPSSGGSSDVKLELMRKPSLTPSTTRVPRSRRLRERMEKRAVNQSPGNHGDDDEDELEMVESEHIQGRVVETVQDIGANGQANEIVIVAFGEQSEEVTGMELSSGVEVSAVADDGKSQRFIVTNMPRKEEGGDDDDDKTEEDGSTVVSSS